METALESAGIQAERDHKARADADMSTGMKMIAAEMKRIAFSGARLAIISWKSNQVHAEEQAVRAYQQGLVEAKNQQLSLRLVKAAFARIVKGMLHESVIQWRQNQVCEQGSTAQSTSEQLQERLSSLIQEHQVTV